MKSVRGMKRARGIGPIFPFGSARGSATEQGSTCVNYPELKKAVAEGASYLASSCSHYGAFYGQPTNSNRSSCWTDEEKAKPVFNNKKDDALYGAEFIFSRIIAFFVVSIWLFFIRSFLLNPSILYARVKLLSQKEGTQSGGNFLKKSC